MADPIDLIGESSMQLFYFTHSEVGKRQQLVRSATRVEGIDWKRVKEISCQDSICSLV